MINIVLIIIFFLATLFSLKIAIVTFYHFKKFDLLSDERSKKILSVFKYGTILMVFASFIIAILIIWR